VRPAYLSVGSNSSSPKGKQSSKGKGISVMPAVDKRLSAWMLTTEGDTERRGNWSAGVGKQPAGSVWA
jgi:hypothetical protein